jgi:hypothetical protein
MMSKFPWRFWRPRTSNIIPDVPFYRHRSNGVLCSSQMSLEASLRMIAANLAISSGSHVRLCHSSDSGLVIARFSTLLILIFTGFSSIHFAMPCQFKCLLTSSPETPFPNCPFRISQLSSKHILTLILMILRFVRLSMTSWRH